MNFPVLGPVTSSQLMMKRANGHTHAAAPGGSEGSGSGCHPFPTPGYRHWGSELPQTLPVPGVRGTHVSHAPLKERAALWVLVEFWEKNDPAGNGSQSNTTQQGLGKGEGAGSARCSQALRTRFCPPAFPATRRGALPLNLLHTR